MRIAVTGSIATDHLMTFPGRFADQLVADQLHTVSLSFLVDTLDVRRGGVGAEHLLRHGTAGPEPDPGRRGRRRLRRVPRVAGPPRGRHRVGAHLRGAAHRPVRVHHRLRPQPDRLLLHRGDERGPPDRAPAGRRPGRRARPGADRRRRPARGCSATPRSAAAGASRSPPTPPSSSPAWTATTSAPWSRAPTYLFTNEYEAALIESKTGWSAQDLLAKVGTRVTTLGARGVRIERAGEPAIEVGCAQEERKVDPTGVGDAFRAGFLSGSVLGPRPGARRPGGLHARHPGHRDAGHPGVRAAPQPLHDRFAKAYGDDAADEVRKHLS